jgi:hypothetical protein
LRLADDTRLGFGELSEGVGSAVDYAYVRALTRERQPFLLRNA